MTVVKKMIALGCMIIISFVINYCNPASSEESIIPFEEIQMNGMDKVSIGDRLEIVVNSQEEYAELIYQRFQKPLDDYWNEHYESILQYVKEQNPGLTNEEYEQLVRDIFYSVLPYKGTENYVHPKIDFSKFTLLGQSAHSEGCEIPRYNIEIKKNIKEYIYRIIITTKGNCSMAIPKNKWVLIPKLPNGYSVKFETLEVR